MIDRLWRCEHPGRVFGRQRPVALAVPCLDARAFDLDLDLVKLAVLRRLRRVVAQKVVDARVANGLFQALSEIVLIDDRAAVGLIRQDAQRILRHLQHAASVCMPTPSLMSCSKAASPRGSSA